MTRLQRHSLSIAVGLLLLALLAYLTLARRPVAPDTLAWPLFTGLLIFTMTFGFPLGGGSVNLMPLIAVGGVLVMGPMLAAWMAVAGSLANSLLRWGFPGQLGGRREPGGLLPVLGIGLANANIIALSILAGGELYEWAGGLWPLRDFRLASVGPFVLLVVSFSALNYLLAGAYIALRGDRQAFQTYRRALPQVAGNEVLPQVFTPLLPLVYTRLGPAPFTLLALAIVAASLIARRLSLTGQDLKQRLTDLSTLSAMGQALAGTLQIDTILSILRAQLPRVMPGDSLYVALYDADHDEVTFPLVVEQGQLISLPSRRAGRGLTEHVLKSRQPLLIPHDVAGRLRELGLDRIGRPAASWVGVPIMAGNDVLGVLALQSFNTEGERYSEAHRELLVTIASQLAVALNNARLYSQTDKALAQRVQQLSSILYSAREGVLLLDGDGCVLTANRALGDLLGLAVAELTGRRLAAADELMARLGTDLAQLQTDQAALQHGQAFVTRTYSRAGPPPRSIERTLAAVQDPAGGIGGWLLVLRDVTEEQALAVLREDLTHMLIHDLRSPLGSILTGLSLIQQVARPGQPLEPDVFDLLQLAQSSGQQLLRLINHLLEIAQLEAGVLPLKRQPALPAALVEATAERLRAAADAATVTLAVDVAPALPAVSVDLEMIGRVLDNLADNAIKYSPDKSEIRLWARAGAVPGTVVFGVSDLGPGIPLENQADLFKKFQRVPGIRGRRAGTGLGLAFGKLVVEAHQGHIWVDSRPGAGSTFAFSLPADGGDTKAPA